MLIHFLSSILCSTKFYVTFAAIPYTVKVVTGSGDDNGTDSNVWIKIYGPKKKCSGKLFLELAQKETFEPGSVETFSLEALEMDEVRQIEVGT